LAVTLAAEVLPFTDDTCMAATPRIPTAKMTMAISTSIKGEATLIVCFQLRNMHHVKHLFLF
jgi:putative effector of murein hydrolase